jgi:hypothetical protein
MRSGMPVASERASLFCQSVGGNSSLQPRSDTAMACRTASVTGYLLVKMDSMRSVDQEANAGDSSRQTRILDSAGTIQPAPPELRLQRPAILVARRFVS